ncbi:hypothetical protein AMS68_003407 [Peltaster fructicola]|uniref:CENP-V/GFA domain-containing protein n=1 Tax=Peltaster fructicola TaxID=286661 RepID=A0A6H0XTV8_9PEZI|nr:hypothetical protein AMS68_003407 [Peltaster fructicola]
MMSQISGTCLCGRIKVIITDTNLSDNESHRGHLCHCGNCRAWGGCVVASIFKIEKQKVTLKGEDNLQSYEDHNTASGNVIYRQFCRHCGSCVLKTTPRSPQSYDISMGLFAKTPIPEFECYRDSRQSWESAVQWPVKGEFGKLPGM